VTLGSLKELVLPTLDDEFAKDLGTESLEKLTENMKMSLARHAEQEKRRQLEAGLLDQLVEQNSFEVPPSIVDQVIDGMIDEMNWKNDKDRAEAKHNKELRTSLLDSAKRRARNTMVLHEIIRAENLQVTDADVDAQIRQMLGKNVSEGGADDAKLMESLRQHFSANLKETLMFTKAVDFVINNSEVRELT
jgi:trigger factor